MKESRLGVGMTYVAGLEPLHAQVVDLLDVIEVEPQTFWLAAPRPLPGEARPPHRLDEEALAQLAELPQTKLVHSVSLPVGSARTPDLDEVDLVAALGRRLDAAWISEHLAFNHAQGPQGPYSTGFFLPPRQTREGVDAIAATIRRFAERLPVPFAFETGVNYLRPRPDELPDGQFIAEVAERADSLILLDLHNIWTNERNGRQPVAEFLSALPLDRVVELHVAGGFELHEFWLDAHSGLVPRPVIELLCETLPRLPNVRALIFEMLPSYAEQLGAPALRRQLEELRAIWQRYVTMPANTEPPALVRTLPVPIEPLPGPSPQEWEDMLGALSIGRTPANLLARELQGDRGVWLYQQLVLEARAGTLAGALPLTIQYLLEKLGEASVRRLLGQFAAAQPPSLFGANEALAFADFLRAENLPLPELPAVVATEREMIIRLLSAA